MSSVDYIIIYLFLFLFFFLYGKRMDNSKKYWLTAIPMIIIYSLIEGVRFDRGPDYLFYKYRFENVATYDETQIVFKWLNQFLTFLDFNYVGAYMVYSLIFIVCAIFFIQQYDVGRKWMYLLFIPATLLFTETFVRQAVGFSFLFLGLRFWNEKKWIYCCIAILISYFIHSSLLITFVIIIFIDYFVRKVPKPVYTICIYLFFALFFDSSNIDIVAKLIRKSGIELDNHFQNYLEYADIWFGKEGIKDIYTQSIITKTLRILFDISIIYIGYISLKRNQSKILRTAYITFVLGAIFYQAFFNLELLRRFAEPLYLFWFVVLGYSLGTFGKEDFKRSPFLKISIISIYLYLILYWGRFIFANPNDQFVWTV